MIHSMFLSTIVLLLFVTCCQSMVNDNTINAPYDDHTRQLQTEQTLNYRATYRAEFHYYRSTSCTADPPVLRLTCFGTEMTIVNTSDATITCTQVTDSETTETNSTTYECQSFCSGSACTSIYESDDLYSPNGSITYTCEGNDYREVDSYFLFVGGSNGTCSTISLVSNQPNFHVGRLGILCPSETGRKFAFDETYFECLSPGTDVFNFAMGNESDIYTCASGGYCQQQECEIMFSDFFISSQLPSFFDKCVDLNNVDLTSFPTMAPQTNPSQFITKFNAAWAELYDSELSRSTCTPEPSPLLITCENGASIVYTSRSNSSVSCTKVGDNELQCIGTTDSTLFPFNSVVYSCVGSSIPTTRVTYTESTVSCNGNSVEAIIDHAVTLGVSCDIAGEHFFYYNDVVFDCADPDHTFDVISNKTYGFAQTRYLCKESTTFAVGSSYVNPMVIPGVAIITSDNWLNGPDGGCFQLAEGVVVFPGEPMSSSDSVPANTNPPTQDLTASTPFTSPTATTNEKSNSSLIGIVIGYVSVVCFAIVALIALLVFFRQQKNSNNVSKDEPITGGIASGPQTLLPGSIINANGTYIRNTSIFRPTQGVPITNAVATTIPQPIKSSNSYNNHLLDVKDQCRSVIVPNMLHTTSPTHDNNHNNNTIIPLAVAIDANSVSTVSTSNRRTKEDPSGHVLTEL